MNTVLEVKHLSLSYGQQIITRDLNFDLCEGEVLCIVGKSGCGKTTLFHALAGLTAPVGGEIVLRGQDIQGNPGHISYMLQKDLLLPNKRIVDNVALPYVLEGAPLMEARQKAFDLLCAFDLEEYANSWPSELSGGMRQRVALLRTYAMDNEVILLDEAFSALDAITRIDVRAWFFSAIKVAGKSCIVITHDIDEAALIADRIFVMEYDTDLEYAKLKGPILTRRGDMDTDEYMLSDAFLQTKKAIMSELGMSE